jgi:hypothetical protein
MNRFKDLMEERFRHKNLCHLEGHITGTVYDLGTHLDQLFPEGSKCPILLVKKGGPYAVGGEALGIRGMP